MKKIIYALIASALFVAVWAVPSMAASTTQALTAAQVAESIMSSDPVGYNPPYGKEDFPEEYIEPMQGSLTLTEDLLYLPGKNGLDLKITATYNNQDFGGSFIAVDKYEGTIIKAAYYYSYDSNGTTKTILVLFENQDIMIENAPLSFYAEELPDASEDDRGTRYYSFSQFDTEVQNIQFTRNVEMKASFVEFYRNITGEKSRISTSRVKINDMWKLNFPMVLEYVDPDLFKTVDEYRYFEMDTAFTDFDGNYCDLYLSYDENTDTHEYSYFYGKTDNTEGAYTVDYYGPFASITDEDKGITYHFKITDSQGRTLYFSRRGFIQAVEDRFGNIIKYTFDETATTAKITKIVDTVGRIVTFVYNEGETSIYVDADGEGGDAPELYVSFINTKTNNVTYDPNDYLVSDDEYVEKLIRYEEDGVENVKTFNYVKRHPGYTSSPISSFYYDDTEYICPTVKDVEHPNGVESCYEYLKIKFYKSIYSISKNIFTVSKRYDKDNNVIYNEYTYEYDPYVETIETRTSDGQTTTYEEEDDVRTILHKADSNTKLKETYVYQELRGKRKIKELKEQFSDNSYGGVTRTTTMDYTSWRPEGVAYDDYEKTLTYFGDSAFLETEVYNQSEDVLVKTVYTLSEEGDDFYTGRTIDTKTVYESVDAGENYTEKYKVNYTYNPDGTLLSETVDPEGINRVTTYGYTYGNDGSITTTATVSGIKDADGNSINNITTSVTVDAFGRVIAQKDGNNNVTRYEYDALGRIVKQTNADNTEKTYEYDTVNRTTIFTDENGVMVKTKYDGFGNVLKVYRNTGTEDIPVWTAVEEYTYDSLCRVASEKKYTGFNGTTPTKWLLTSYTYGAFDKVYEVLVTDESGTEITKDTYTYNFADKIGTIGLIAGHDSANGGTSRKFTSVTVIQDAKDGITPPVVKQFYDRRDRLVKQIRTDGDEEYITTYVYDALGNLLEMKDETAYKEYDVDYTEKYEYNYLNKVVKAYNAEGNYTENTYDTLGRCVTATDYMGNSRTYTYDVIDRVLTEAAPVDTNVNGLVKYYYDGNGNVTSKAVKSGAGTNVYTYGYDERGRLVSRFDGAAYSVTEYDGNRTLKTASGLTSAGSIDSLTHTDDTYNVTEYEYDKYGNVLKEKTFNGETSYTYDLNGNTLTTTDSKGQTTTNTYDSFGRMTTSSVGSDVISYSYNSFGLTTSASRNGVITTYVYDNLGRNLEETTGGKTITRTYNTAGQVMSMSLKENGEVLQSAEYEYNILGNMLSATDGTEEVMYTYNENGLPTREERGGFITSYTYTPGNLMKTVTNQRRYINDPTDEEVYNDIMDVSYFTYNYSPDGNVSTCMETRGSDTLCNMFRYDAANRITNHEITDTSDNNFRHWIYTYNNRGDRVSSRLIDPDYNSTTTTYAYTNHRLTSETTGDEVTTYTYDANGNMLTKTKGDEVYTYTYTPRNEVASVTVGTTTESYVYNASSLRVGKITGGVETGFIWAGDNIIREETTGKETEYFYGVNRILRRITGDAYSYNISETTYDEEGNRVTVTTPVSDFHEFYAYDGRGNVVHTMAYDTIDLYISPQYNGEVTIPEVEMNGDGEIDIMDINGVSTRYPIIRNYYYSAFGEIWQGEVSSDTNPFRYGGEYYDKTTGNIYLRARYYDPRIGRFISVDPIKDGTNWYVYCSNNPVMFVDPSGLSELRFSEAPVGEVTPENDKISLNSEGLLLVARLTSIYNLAEKENNTLIKDAMRWEMTKVRINPEYHNLNVENNPYADGVWDTYSYSDYDYMIMNTKVEIHEYNSVSAAWENGAVLGQLSNWFSVLSDCGDVQFYNTILPVDDFARWGGLIVDVTNEFIFDPVNVDVGDLKITITTSGWIGKTCKFYFLNEESTWFDSRNIDNI